MTQGTKRGLLTARGIAAMKAGEWAADPAARGAGRLQVRKLASGEAAWYYRYTGPAGDRVRLPIGTGLDLAEARQVAAALSRRYQAGERDLRAVLEAEQREAAREREATARAADAATTRAKATLGALLGAYVEHLKRAGKVSARQVETCIARNVEKPWPKLWAKPAADVDLDDLLAVVAEVANTGRLREAAKLRSYLRAAYAAAIRARQDALGLPALRELRITSNPARDLVTIEGATTARERALSVAELRAYWRRIAGSETPGAALLRFHALTGGQRVAQLQRLTVNDLDPDASAVRLRDGKGRRREPRAHDVPLIPEAMDALDAMRGGQVGPHLFTLTAGETGAGYGTVRDVLAGVVADMAEAGELERGAFTLGDLRRTVETRLAAEGVPLDVRAQLQSHGLGGVQARHYDRHNYLEEKRSALRTLHRLVTGTAAKVTPIRKRAR